MIYGGIDPGKDGAIVIIHKDDIKIYGFPKIGTEYDFEGLNNIFKLLAKIKGLHVVIEDVKKMPKMFSSGDWMLSRSKTSLEVLCVVHKIKFTLVHAKTWQKEMHEGVPPMKRANGKKDTKSMSEVAAKRLFPDMDFRSPYRKRENVKNSHDGVIDALLMAEYAKRKF
jgi:hypothetical protein